MEKKNKLIELGILPEVAESGVSKISLVEDPAIEADFLYFKKEEFVEPNSGESKQDYLSRCIAYNIKEGQEVDQAAAVCYSKWQEKHAATKISFDFDDTLSTASGQAMAQAKIDAGNDVYVISARSDKSGILEVTDKLGIDPSKVFATGSNKAKVAKVKELGIQKHIDNNQDVIDELGSIGEKFSIDTSTLPPYVDETPRKDEVETPQPTWSWNFSDEFLIALEKLGSELGFTEDQVEVVDAHKFADARAIKDSEYTPARTHKSTDPEEFLWKYGSSRVSTSGSRGFCRTMMSLNRYYSREEVTLLNNLNTEFGPGGSSEYSIFLYKGGANCQHFWKKYSVTRDGSRLKLFPVDVDGSNEEHMAATAPRTLTGRGYIKSPQNSLPGLAGRSEFSSILKFADEEQRILVGPCMIPNMEIPRLDDNGQPYSVTFSAETIAEIAKKYMKEARTNDVNQDHEEKDAGTYVFETWLIEDPETDKANTVYGFNFAKGTWMVKMQVEDPAVWKRVKAGELKGFSVEGLFSDMEEIEAQRTYTKIKKILKG